MTFLTAISKLIQKHDKKYRIDNPKYKKLRVIKSQFEYLILGIGRLISNGTLTKKTRK
jgi:hypothetical protein